LRIKEQETRLTLQEHDDDDDECDYEENNPLPYTSMQQLLLTYPSSLGFGITGPLTKSN